jgi:cellulose synthase/poly-beta-1,6-N-acetylglucosamine synthase-like glycosyltransferase
LNRIPLVVAAVAAALAVYPFIIYPLLVRFVAWVRPRPWKRAEAAFDVAHIITVYNEGRRIRQKLENTVALRYPGTASEIIVASDGSTDESESVVAEFASRGVRWIGCERQGKEHAQLAAIRSTVVPIIVFSDASTILEEGSVMKLLEPFADPEVGAVSGRDVIATREAATGEDIYVRYEMELRKAESLAGSLVGLSGCFFAARREVVQALKTDVPSDLGAALLCVERRLRAVHVDDARCGYTTIPSVEKEFARKRRTALRGLRGLLAHRQVFHSGRIVVTWQIVSHKLLRFASPVFAAAACAALGAAAIAGSPMAQLMLLIVTIGICLGITAIAWPFARRVGSLRAAGFLLLSNLAVGAALVDLASKRKAVQWTPTRRN